MFKKLLVANRGEIALRVMRGCRELGVRTVAVYSDPDRSAPHVRAADEAYGLGGTTAAESYLRGDRIIEIARACGAEAIHPGYGFLAENADFAEACGNAGLVFVGPPPAAMRALGSKTSARRVMQEAGVPVVPGYHGERQDGDLLKRKAYEIGSPVLIKAVAGGGGKGMRLVERHADFDAALEAAKREAASAFGDARVLIEKYISSPRHIEIQVFADKQGSAIHLGERDCSLQRRHQKVIEEAPAPGMTPQLRARMGEAAVAAAKAVGYVGAGTVEFIADGANGLKADGFWFMEMNTRLQVEHPVTEMVTGFDLVEWQFRVAEGKRLPVVQSDVSLHGHAVEARVYAEDPDRGFLPSTGKLLALSFPESEGIRVDSGVEQGGDISPYYDPMIAKVIAHAGSRKEALDALAQALDATVIAGPRTNLAFLGALCRSLDFREGRFDTSYIDGHRDELGVGMATFDAAAAASGVAHLLARETTTPSATEDDPWNVTDAFQLSGPRVSRLPIIVNGEPEVAVLDYATGVQRITVHDAEPDPKAQVFDTPAGIYVLSHGRQTVVALADFGAADADHGGGDGVIRAPMHGKLLAVLIKPGEAVIKGQRVALIEAMKMEHALLAPVDGIASEFAADVGTQLAEGAPIVTIAPVKSDA